MTKREECERCGGYGYLDEDGDRECPACGGDGVAPVCDAHELQNCERCEGNR